MISIGLTGSIGMGKSTTAALFREEGATIWDADEAVRRLYGPGGGAVPAIAALAPEAVVDGAVDRTRLREAILADPPLLKRIEAAVHPLVAADRAAAREQAKAAGARVAVFDIPLLFETGGEGAFDLVVVVSAPEAMQRARVLARPGMTETAFEAILAKQTSDAEKRQRADVVIDTGAGLETARAEVRALMRRLEQEGGDA